MTTRDTLDGFEGELNKEFVKKCLRNLKLIDRTIRTQQERTKFLNDRRGPVSELRNQLLGKGCEAESDWETVRVKIIYLISRRLASQDISAVFLLRITDALAKSDPERGSVLRQFIHEFPGQESLPTETSDSREAAELWEAFDLIVN
jgi:hypothetical protein